MHNEKFMFTCDVCGGQYQMGRHKYDGKQIPRYQLGVCKMCYDSNWNGWTPEYEQKILDHLIEKGLPEPDRNENGLLPRD